MRKETAGARPPARHTNRGRGPGTVPLTLALALVALGSTCQPGPRMPEQATPPPAPFVRPPYLQAVTGSTAVVRWSTRASAPGTLRYRRAGEEWSAARVQRTALGGRRAELRGLSAGEHVEYEVREGGTELGPFEFGTAPPDTSGAPVRVLGFGDSGWGSRAQTSLAALMRTERWALAVHVGDIAYDDGSEEDFTQRHFGVYGNLFARTPFFPVPGNHDLRTEGGAPYDRAFDWPGEEPGRRYYTFRWGRVRFVALDTSTKPGGGGVGSGGEAAEETAGMAGLEEGEGEQYRWLAETLEAAARDTTLRWTVLYTHYPLYSHGTGLSGHGPRIQLRQRLEPLLLAHGVDLVLTGHEHHYERSLPLRDGEVVPGGCGPVHLILGGGGASRFARTVRPDFHTGRVSRDHHYVELVFRRGAVEGRAIRPDGSVLDRFEVEPYEAESAGTAACEG